MTYSEFTLAHELPVRSVSSVQGRDKNPGVCLQSSTPAHVALSFTSDPAPAVRSPETPLGFPGWISGYGRSQIFEEIDKYASAKKVLCTCCKYFMYKARSISLYANS